MFAGRDRGLPARLARDGFEAMQEARGHRRRAADFCRMAEDDILGAEQLGKIVRRQPDAPFRQIEPEAMPHRPAQPGIHPRRRRPDALDQSAEDDAVGLRQPRFQRAIDPQLRVGDLRPPHHAVGEGGLEQLRIVAQRHHQPARRALAEQIVERGGQHQSLMALEGERRVMFVARQFYQYIAMLFGERREIMRFCRSEVFQRRKGGLQQPDQLACPFQFANPALWFAAPNRAARMVPCA